MKHVSLNDQVKVKLDEVGIELLRLEHNYKRNDLMKAGLDIGEFQLVVDEQGYSSFAIAEFMESFGDYVHMGEDAPFGMDLLF